MPQTEHVNTSALSRESVFSTLAEMSGNGSSNLPKWYIYEFLDPKITHTVGI